jgi:hypothetical protein
MDDRWGDLCATPEIASRSADRLIDLVQHVNAERLGKAQCHLRTDAGSAIQQARERHAADAQALGCIGYADVAQGLLKYCAVLGLSRGIQGS